jgi:predicted RNA-binding Zn ribbon-like protein
MAWGKYTLATPTPHATARTQITCLNCWLAATRQQAPQLRAGPGPVAVLDPDSTRPGDAHPAFGHLAPDAAQIIGTGLPAWLRICPGPAAPGGSSTTHPPPGRRWCSMAVCGNRQKAAARRHRQQ